MTHEAPEPKRPQPESLREVVNAIDGVLTQNSERLQRASARWSELGQALIDAFETVGPALAMLVERIQDVFPENWRTLEDDERHAAVDFVGTGELCIVWVPRAEVLGEVVTAPH